jgi:hypothetical protein
VRLRWFGNEKMQAMCGKCDNWVSTSAKTPDGAVKTMPVHQKGKACQSTWELKQRYKPDTSHQDVHSEESNLFPGCTGIVLEWPGKSIWRAYPWQRHEQGRGQLPWTIHYYDTKLDEMHIRSRRCLGSFGPDGQPCTNCSAVKSLVEDKFRTTFNDPEAGASTNWTYRVWEQHYGHRVATRAQIERLRRDVCV